MTKQKRLIPHRILFVRGKFGVRFEQRAKKFGRIRYRSERPEIHIPGIDSSFNLSKEDSKEEEPAPVSAICPSFNPSKENSKGEGVERYGCRNSVSIPLRKIQKSSSPRLSLACANYSTETESGRQKVKNTPCPVIRRAQVLFSVVSIPRVFYTIRDRHNNK